MSTRQSHREPSPTPRGPILLRYVALGALIGLIVCVTLPLIIRSLP